jgi:hypothetical protein
VSRITEYVGPDGIESSEMSARRMGRPRPGDLVEWPDGTLGMVSEVEKGLVGPGEVMVVNTLGSAFLRRSTVDGVMVSISGGPFTVLKFTDLLTATRLEKARFWNWGDNGSGADKGVDYWLARPVFKVTRAP